MRRKYGDCVRLDGNCVYCERVAEMKDCKGRPITKLEWARMSAGLTIKELAIASGVSRQQIQRVELGKGKAENLTAKNIIAIAKVLNTDPESLI